MSRSRRSRGRIPEVRRAAVLSMHTSPLAQPGTGDAGGMNVYVWETATRMAESGVDVEIFTRATAAAEPVVLHPRPGITVHNIAAGPFQGLGKDDLPGQMCAFTAGVLRAEAARPEGWFDVIHSHYWLSGQVGWVAAERWNAPLVHSMHTMALVKNRDRGPADADEPNTRAIGEQQVVDIADLLVANTEAEAGDLVRLYRADPRRVAVVHPGVDLKQFSPGDQARARIALGLPTAGAVVAFVGRLQPLKAPDLLLAAAARMTAGSPTVVICGGASGNGATMPEQLRAQAEALGIAERTIFLPPLPKDLLAELYRAATVVAVPSHSESFGLVAVEAQACGTPVVAAAVGGLTTAVADGASGLLVDSHRATDWAAALDRVCSQPALRRRLARGARHQAEMFGWERTTGELLDGYSRAMAASTALAGADLVGA